jgi:hypothetical protein
MSDADKKTVLQHALERAEKDSITANNVEFAEDGEDAPGSSNAEEEAEGTVDVNNVTTDAKKTAHPGDLRRMMGGKGKGGAKKKTQTQSFMVDFTAPTNDDDVFALTGDDIDDVLESYWNGEEDSNSESDFHRGD